METGTSTRRPEVLTEAQKARLSEMEPHKRFGRSGYVMNSHAVVTILPRKMPPSYAMLRSVLYILDRTLGAAGRPEWVKVSAAGLARQTGLTAQGFTAALDEAWRLGLVDRRDADGRGREYRCYPEAWEKLPDLDREKPAKVATVEEEVAEEEDDSSASTPAVRDSGVVLSGKSAKSVVLSVSLKGVPDPVDLRVQPRNDSGLPLRFLTSVDLSGLITVRVRHGGEEKAKDEPDHQLQLSSARTISLSSQRLTAFREYVNFACVKFLAKAADPALVDRVVKLSGEATVDEFATLVETRLARRGGNHTAGILLEIAKDAARAHAARAALMRESQPAAAPAVPTGYPEAHASRVGDSLNDFRAISGNPAATVEDWLAAGDELLAEFGLLEEQPVGADA